MTFDEFCIKIKFYLLGNSFAQSNNLHKFVFIQELDFDHTVCIAAMYLYYYYGLIGTILYGIVAFAWAVIRANFVKISCQEKFYTRDN